MHKQTQTSAITGSDEWKRIISDAICIVHHLRSFGYGVRKQVRRPVWVIQGKEFRYELHYLPKPVEEWTLLPAAENPIRNRLMLLVEQALAQRGGGR